MRALFVENAGSDVRWVSSRSLAPDRLLHFSIFFDCCGPFRSVVAKALSVPRRTLQTQLW
jgi:hypothetical protein